jgi:5-bromo-4-chloroindolyl phosphate hydrolysis protein
MVFPPAVIPAIVVPLVAVGAGFLVSSVAMGIAAAYYDYKVVQPKEQVVAEIKTQNQQYKTLKSKLEHIENQYKAEDKLLEKADAQDASKQNDRLQAMKNTAQDAVKRLSQDFKTMITEMKAHFQSKKILPDFDFIAMKPRREQPLARGPVLEEEPLPLIDTTAQHGMT